jgi:hypothetical protein
MASLIVMVCAILFVIAWFEFPRIELVYESVKSKAGEFIEAHAYAYQAVASVAEMSGFPVEMTQTTIVGVGSWIVTVILVGTGLAMALISPPMLAWAVPAMGISLATGREAFTLPAVTLVEAEPLPDVRSADCLRPAEMALEILYNARSTGLNHSLYDAPEVRQRIASWLREQARRQR